MLTFAVLKLHKMEKEFIPYEQALALKELGFDGSCFSLYFNNGEFSNFIHAYKVNDEVVEKTNSVLAPTFSQAFRFFREKYWLHSTLHLNPRGYYTTISKKINNLTPCVFSSEVYNVPEDAELECLKKLIEIVKVK